MTANSRGNGVIVGYRARYGVKGASPRVWLYQDFQSRSVYINSLRKYTMYEFAIAAQTSKGTGVFSSLIEERTKEDGT